MNGYTNVIKTVLISFCSGCFTSDSYIYIHTYICGRRTSLMCMGVRSAVERGFCTVPRIVLFWTETSDVLPGICWSYSSNILFSQPPVLPSLLAHVAVARDCHIYCHCLLDDFTAWCNELYLCVQD